MKFNQSFLSLNLVDNHNIENFTYNAQSCTNRIKLGNTYRNSPTRQLFYRGNLQFYTHSKQTAKTKGRYCNYIEIKRPYNISNCSGNCLKSGLPAQNGEKAGKSGWSESGNRRAMSGAWGRSPQPPEARGYGGRAPSH